AQGPAGGAVLEVGVDEFGRAELHARVVDLFLQRAHDAAVDLRAAAGVGADVQRAQRVGAADLVTEDHRAVAAVVQRQAARLGRVAAGRVDELGEVDLATGAGDGDVIAELDVAVEEVAQVAGGGQVAVEVERVRAECQRAAAAAGVVVVA